MWQTALHTHTHTHVHTYMRTYIHTHTHTHTHIYIYIYIHTHTYIYTYTYIHTQTYIHTYTNIHIHIYTHTPKYIHTYIHTYCTYTPTYIHTYCTYIHTHIYTYMNTHIHTYIHTYILACIHTYLHADAVKIIEIKEYKEQTIQVYTDGSKNEHGVRYGVAIFVGKELAVQLKFKLDNRCSNKQVEQLAVAKALEVIETTDIMENSPHTVAIFTDSRITIDLLKNVNNHSYVIEEIRKRISTLERANWAIKFSWVKTHVGIYGNELADQLAKDAVRNRDSMISFNRIPKSTLYSETEEEAKQKGKKNGKDVRRQP